jgi:hypothetical protein
LVVVVAHFLLKCSRPFMMRRLVVMRSVEVGVLTITHGAYLRACFLGLGVELRVIFSLLFGRLGGVLFDLCGHSLNFRLYLLKDNNFALICFFIH